MHKKQSHFQELFTMPFCAIIDLSIHYIHQRKNILIY